MVGLVPLLVVFVAPPTSPSPVAYIINKLGFVPPTLITSGVIVSDTYVITPNYPVSTVVVSQVCVLPATNIHKVDKSHIRNFCKDIKTITSLRQITLLELTQALIFTYKVNAAAIPAVKTLNGSLDLTKNCQLVVNYRYDGFVVSHGVVPVSLQVTGSNIRLVEERQFCGGDTGLPVYCENAVVGIMLFPQSKDVCCPSGCIFNTLLHISIFSENEIQDLLREKIGFSSG